MVEEQMMMVASDLEDKREESTKALSELGRRQGIKIGEQVLPKLVEIAKESL
jgi:hypothetical protein